MCRAVLVISLSFLGVSCHRVKPRNTAPVAHGETAFLFQYNGRLPGDVGFLTNHIVERRLANMLKDSFTVFMSKTTYAKPIMVCDSSVVRAIFFTDSLLQNQSAEVIIDVGDDAFWVDYESGDFINSFSDHPSSKKPRCE